MKQKIILSISLMLLLGLAVFVIAARPTSGDQVTLEEGWNLVHFYPNPVDSITVNSEIQIEDILAVFLYINSRHKMYRAYPDSNVEEDGYVTQADFPYLFNSAYWIYSTKKGTLEVSREGSGLSLGETKLSKGWNFLGLIEEMTDKYMDDIKGTCEVEKAYIWDSRIQEWSDFLEDLPVYGGEIGMGSVIKVQDDCILADLTGVSSANPPSIPN